jgi:hypothetical protein
VDPFHRIGMIKITHFQFTAIALFAPGS